MYSLDSLPARDLLLAFDTYEGADYLRYLRDTFARNGYRKYTRKRPEGREITRDDVRHMLHPLLKQLPDYDPTRPLTRCHQDLLKACIRRLYVKGELA
jgi:hypothetical protein